MSPVWSWKGGVGEGAWAWPLLKGETGSKLGHLLDLNAKERRRPLEKKRRFAPLLDF